MKIRGFSWLSGWLLAGLLAFTVRAASADEPAPAVYVNDVEFLLAQLEAKAGHFFPLKGIDWSDVSRQFRKEVQSVTNDPGHIRLCTRLVARLRDGHALLRDLKVKLPDESQGRRWTGPRVHLLAATNRVYVRAAFGPATGLGITPGMEVLSIDGKPARDWLDRRVIELRDDHGYSTPQMALYAACHWGLADWEGTKIEFELLSGTERKPTQITRRGGPNFAPLGPIVPPEKLTQLGRQSYGKTPGGVPYIHLRDVPAQLPQQLDSMLEKLEATNGLVLDLRANGGGGCDHAAVFGRFLAEGQSWRQYRGTGRKPFTGPMVLIVDAGTRSAGETVAGMFKEDGRAYLIGDEPTAGMSSSKETIAVPSGLFTVYFSVASNMGRFNRGRGLEGLGVAPHEIVPYDPAELRRGIDTQIRRAEELLKNGFPDSVVPYETEAE